MPAPRPTMPIAFPCGHKRQPYGRATRTREGYFVCPCGIAWKCEQKFVKVGKAVTVTKVVTG